MEVIWSWRNPRRVQHPRFDKLNPFDSSLGWPVWGRLNSELELYTSADFVDLGMSFILKSTWKCWKKIGLEISPS
jgi:hypothetical protein